MSIFRTIEDEASKSGKRIESIFTTAANKIDAVLNTTNKLTFDGDFSKKLSADTKALNEFFVLMDRHPDMNLYDAIKVSLTGASAEVKKYALSYKEGGKSVQDFSKQQINAQIALDSSNKSFENCVKIINSFNAGFDKTTYTQNDFVAAVGRGNSVLGNYLKSIGASQASFKGYIKYAAQAKIATIGLQAAYTAANMALTMGISALIQVLGTAITNKISEITEAAERAKDAAIAYEETADSIEDYVKRVKELRSTLDESNISEEKAYETRSELLKIQDELVEKFGDEARSINLVTGAIEQQIAAIKKIPKDDWTTFEQENNRGIQQAVDYFTNLSRGGIDKMFSGNQDAKGDFLVALPDYFTIDQATGGNKTIADNFTKKVKSEIEKLIPEDELLDIGIGFEWNAGDRSPYEVLEVYRQIYDVIRDVGEEEFGQDYQKYIGSTLNSYSKNINALIEDIEKHEQTFNTHVEGKLSNDERYVSMWSDILVAQQEYQEALLSGDGKAIQTAIEKMDAAQLSFLNAEDVDSDVNLYLTRFFAEWEKQVKDYKLRLEVEGQLKISDSSTKAAVDGFINAFKNAQGQIDALHINNVGLTVDSKLAGIQPGGRDWHDVVSGLNAEEQAYAQLSLVAHEYGQTVTWLLELLQSLGIITLSNTEALQSEAQSVSNIISSYRNSVNALSDAADEFAINGSISPETYNKVISLGEDYADLFVFTAEGIELEADAIDALIPKLMEEAGAKLVSANATEEQIQQTMTAIQSLKSYANSSDTAMDAIKDFVDIQKDMEEGTEYSTFQMLELVEKYPELAVHIQKTANGYIIEANAIKALIGEKSKLLSINDSLMRQSTRSYLESHGMSETAKVTDEILAEHYRTTGTAIKSWEEFLTARGEIKGWSANVEFNEGYKEDVLAAIADFNAALLVEDAYKDFLNGTYLSGTSGDDAETEFEKQYKLHQHLVAIGKETDQEYLNWLKGAYEDAYNAKQIKLDEYYQYAEEVYDLEKQLFDDSLSDMEHNIFLLEKQVENSIGNLNSLKQKVSDAANAYNALTNGNLDYNKRPVVNAETMWASGWTDFPAEDLATTYSEYNTIGEGEYLYTIDITPILENGKVLTREEFDNYINSLVTTEGISGLLASDTENLIINVSPGDYDEAYWTEYQNALRAVKSEHLELWNQLQNAKNPTDDIIDYYHTMQDQVHAEAEKLRAQNVSEDDARIQELQQKWWQYEEAIHNAIDSAFSKFQDDEEYKLSLLSVDEGDSDKIISIYRGLQNAILDEIDKHKKEGLTENDDLIQKLREQWQEYEDDIADTRTEAFENHISDAEFAINLLRASNGDSKKIVGSYTDILKEINDEIAYHIANGKDMSSEVIQELIDKSDSIRDELKSVIDDIVGDAEEAVGKFKDIISDNFSNISKRAGAVGSAIAEVNKQVAKLNTAANTYLSEMATIPLSNRIKAQIESGTINIDNYDVETQNLIRDYQELYEASKNAIKGAEDLADEIANIYQENFNNLKEDFDNQLSILEHESDMIDKELDLMEASGRTGSSAYYNQLISLENDRVSVLRDQLSSLKQAMQDALASGEIDMYSDAWYDMKNSILDTEEAIKDAELSVKEFQNAIRDMEWENFDNGMKKFDHLGSNIQYYIDLLSHDDLTNEDGSLTESGKDTIGLHGLNFDLLMQAANEYAMEAAKVAALLERDPLNQDLIDRRAELIELQQDSVLAAMDEKEAIKDLIQEGIDGQIDAMQKLIDKYTEALDSAKDLYDYQNKVSDITKDIGKLQKQIIAYEGDDSEETKAQMQKLKEELLEKQEDLQETEFEKYISDQKKLFDDLFDGYSKLLNSRLDNIDSIMISSKNELSSIGSILGGIYNSVNSLINDPYGVIGTRTITRYATGGLNKKTGLAWLDGTKTKPEAVLNAEDTKNFIALRDVLQTMANNGVSIANTYPSVDGISYAHTIPGLSQRKFTVENVGGNNDIRQEVNITIPIDHIDDYNDFVSKLKTDKRFEKMVQAMTVDQIAGRSSLAKHKYSWNT